MTQHLCSRNLPKTSGNLYENARSTTTHNCPNGKQPTRLSTMKEPTTCGLTIQHGNSSLKKSHRAQTCYKTDEPREGDAERAGHERATGSDAIPVNHPEGADPGHRGRRGEWAWLLRGPYRFLLRVLNTFWNRRPRFLLRVLNTLWNRGPRRMTLRLP